MSGGAKASSTIRETDFATISTSSTPYTSMKAFGQIIDLKPIDRICSWDQEQGFWSEESFNSDLKLPPVSMEDDSVIVNSLLFTFQAQAPGFLEVVLSPKPNFVLESSYQLTFGGGSNMKCVCKRRIGDGQETAFCADFPARACDPDSWINYWVAMKEGKVYIGINDNGEDEEIDYSKGIDGKSSPFHGFNTLMEVDDTLFDALRPSQNRAKYVGIGNFAGLGFKKMNTNATRNIRVRNVCLRHMRESDVISPTRNISRGVFIVKPKVEGKDATFGYDTTKSLMKEWGEECEKQRKRAEKFGHDYTTPSLESFMKWSEAKRLRSNPSQGFITGIDVTSTEEEEKRKRRQERFERDAKRERNRKRGRSVDADEEEEDMQEEPKEEKKEENKDLPPEQAYTNEKWLSTYRVDPNGEEKVPEKVHLFCIDIAAFKQIRTNDILNHFQDFGPSYVEWLGETSVNVMFEDKFSAARALKALGQEIPVKEIKVKEGEGDAMVDTAEPEAKPAPEGKETSVVEEVEEGEEKMEDGEPEVKKNEECTDLAALGWLFCKAPLVKVKDDRFGRRGTRSRFLLRTATTLDNLEALEDVVQLKMPKGWSTNKVISGRTMREEREQREQRQEERGGGKRRRRNGDGEDRGGPRDVEESLGMELKAGRGSGAGSGFSLEEIMAERAAKKGEVAATDGMEQAKEGGMQERWAEDE